MPVLPADLSRLRLPALAVVFTNVFIVFTGGIVRVTGSGKGCPDWPTCDGLSVVPPPAAESGLQPYIEFGNRLVTFLVLAAALWAVWAVRRHAADRQDLQRLAWWLVGGVLGQALLGGITVWTDLNVWVVMAHFLLSMVLIAVAVVLYDRVVGAPADTHPGLGPLSRLVALAGAAVLVLGTFVTAAGPHAGDPGTPRLALDIRTLATAHADAVWALLALLVATVVVAHAAGATRTRRAAIIALAVALAQGSVGYLQYVLGIPAGLVSLHLLGAALLWVAVVRTTLAAR